MKELWAKLPSQPVVGLDRGDGSQQAVWAGIGSGLTCSVIATLVFTAFGLIFTPAVLAAWPGALVLGVVLGWLAGAGLPRWGVVLCGGAIPFVNTLISAAIVAIISGEPMVSEFSDDGGLGLDPLGVAMAGMMLFSPLLVPLGLLAGWFVHRAVVRAVQAAQGVRPGG